MRNLTNRPARSCKPSAASLLALGLQRESGDSSTMKQELFSLDPGIAYVDFGDNVASSIRSRLTEIELETHEQRA